VPGVSSAVAAPMDAGVPVTHRGMSAAFTVVTGHRRAGEHEVDWRSLAAVGGTIVVLMGVAQRAEIARELMAGGLSPDTPVAISRSATTAAHVARRCLLGNLGDTPTVTPSATSAIAATVTAD
jgi:uroporphyrin-III C-methyltransferase